MAKTVRQQLADLAGGKKPNVFYKGLNSDIDEHLIGNEQFTDAMNVRINSKDSDNGTIQNLESNILLEKISLSAFRFNPVPSLNLSLKFWHDGALNTSNDETLQNIKLKFTKSDGSLINFGTGAFANDFILIQFGISSFIYDGAYQENSYNYSNDDVILHIYDSLKNNDTFLSVMDVSLGTYSGGSKGNTLLLYFFPLDINVIPASVNPISLISLIDDGQNLVPSSQNTYTSVGFGAGDDGFILYPLSLTSFTNYIAAVCFQSTTIQAVVKIFLDEFGAVKSIIPCVISDFGLASNDTNIRVQKIEENDSYNRLYWTDGVNPIKTVNLEATGGFYQGFIDEDDFNLFSKSPLRPVEIVSVRNGGSINCGSWSYCYRLKTDDGKSSIFSPISNPLPLTKSPANSQSHLVEGGLLSDNSGKSVTLRIEGIDTVYTSIELIGIQYLDEIGGAVFYIIKEEGISGEVAQLTHNGFETTSVITAAEILTKQNTWDVAQDLAVKDNRLFASNLKNNADEVVADFNTFRVKSYKHSSGSAGFGSPTGGSYSTYSDTYINPDLYEPELYKISATDTTKFRYAEGPGDNTPLSFGASSEGYHPNNTGVYVTFKLKEFDLNNTNYWHSFVNNEGTTIDGVCVPPYYQTYPTGQDSSFNNYKNPVFVNQFLGYMRDEVYRFGIQFYDKNGNQSFTYPVGDIRFPSIENDYRFLGDDGSIPITFPNQNATAPYNTTAGDGTVGKPKKYILMDSSGKGYILYPQFRVKLSPYIRSIISGFSIVRAERDDQNKRVVAAGMLQNTLIYANSAENKELKDKIGLEKLNFFTQKTGANNFGTSSTEPNADESSCYILDTPEVLFDSLSYTVTSGDLLKICNTLLCKSYDTEDKPTGAVDAVQVSDTTGEDVDWMTDSSDSTKFYAAPMQTDNAGVAPNALDTKQYSFFSLYHCDDNENSPLASDDISTHAQHYTKTLHYGQNVGSDEFVPAELLSSTKAFRNRVEIYESSNNLSHIAESNGIVQANSKTMVGNKSLLLNLTSNAFFTMSIASIFNGTNTAMIKNTDYYAVKPYAKIIKPFTNTSGQYGGNNDNTFINQRWISTGASLHGDEILETEMVLDVFGGDTFINMMSLNKFHQESFNADAAMRIGQGLIFPVESSVNVDMRRGTYFGKNNANVAVQDEYLVSSTYSATNNLKSFPAKDPKVRLVQNYRNLVAASNVKIAGQTSDAFSKFDANEIFEVNMNYGAISNLETFRDKLYCIQERATSILSVNTRALINAKDGAAISIQSALGVGNVIERNDYISTEYGSQNKANCYSTDKGLYWIDNDHASICMVSIKQPNIVLNLSELKGCTSILSDIKRNKLFDKPLFVNKGTSQADTDIGGISISYNPYYNELLFSMSYYFNESDAKEVRNLTIAYNESIEQFIGKRSYSPILNCVHKGHMYSVGYEHSNVFSSETDISRRKLFIHDSDNFTSSGVINTPVGFNNFYESSASNPSITFVNNEQVGSLKVFDKLVLSTEEIVDTGIFSKFVFNTNVDGVETLDLTSTDIDKVKAGKQIVPIFVSKRQKGNYVKIKVEQGTNQSLQKFNLFSATTYFRKNII